MKTFSASLAFYAENSPVPGEFSTQRPVTRSFDVFFDVNLNKQLSKQSRGWWFETPSGSLWRQCKHRIVIVVVIIAVVVTHHHTQIYLHYTIDSRCISAEYSTILAQYDGNKARICNQKRHAILRHSGRAMSAFLSFFLRKKYREISRVHCIMQMIPPTFLWVPMAAFHILSIMYYLIWPLQFINHKHFFRNISSFCNIVHYTCIIFVLKWSNVSLTLTVRGPS